LSLDPHGPLNLYHFAREEGTIMIFKTTSYYTESAKSELATERKGLLS